jgi:hypothetical protein
MFTSVRGMWGPARRLLLRIRATFSEIVSTNAASGVGVETSAQRIAELAARSLRNIARTEKNRTALYKAGPNRYCSLRHIYTTVLYCKSYDHEP